MTGLEPQTPTPETETAVAPDSAGGPGPDPRTGSPVVRWVRSNWIFGVLVGIIVIFSLASSHFLTQANWLNTSSTATEVLLLAVGQTFVIVSAGIDLSVGAVLGLSGMCGAWVMQHYFSHQGIPTGSAGLVTAIGFAVTIGVGTLAGLVNGVLIAAYDIPPFVVTLGTLGIATGLADLVSNGQEISTIPMTIGNIGNDNLGGWIPIPVLIAVVCTVIGAVALARTRFGAKTYAIGDSREAARRAGIADGRHLLWIYTLSGALAGVASITVMTRLGAASPTSGSNDELNAIAAVVIGGASLFGGRGTVVGSLIGTCIIAVLLTGLIIIDVPSFWQLVTVGVVLIVAVYVDRVGTGERGGIRRLLLH